MRLFLCSIVLFALFIIGCKKTSGDAVSARTYNEKLKGNWKRSAETNDYYNSTTNQLINEDISNITNSLSFDGEGNLSYTIMADSTRSGTASYAITADNGAYYLTAAINQFGSLRYKILVLDNTTLQISAQILPPHTYSYHNSDYLAYTVYTGLFKHQ